MINEYLLQLSPEIGGAIYNSLGYLQWPAFVAVLLFATVYCPATAKDKVVIWVAFLVARFWSGSIVPVLSRLTGKIIPAINLGVAFGFFVLMVAAIAFCLRAPVLLALDVAVPTYIFGRGLAIIGCIFSGCCYGFSVPWGIYSDIAKTLVFPAVVLDIVFSCCIAGYLLFLLKKMCFCGNGSVAAKGILFFGLLRVLIDILRDNEKLMWMLTSEGFFGIAYVLAGCILLRTILVRGEKDGK